MACAELSAILCMYCAFSFLTNSTFLFSGNQDWGDANNPAKQYKCPYGKFTTAMRGSCATCPAGKYSLQQASVCIDCEAGKYSAETGVSACLNCDPGKSSLVGSESVEGKDPASYAVRDILANANTSTHPLELSSIHRVPLNSCSLRQLPRGKVVDPRRHLH